MRQLLSDVAVVEVSTEPAGSYCAKVFADLGADVVKVEPPSGDPQRGHPERFVHLNTNKRAIALRDDESGREQLMELLGSADVVVESHGVGDLQGFGVSRDELRAQHPALVVATISGFGTTGPYASYRWSDLVAQVASVDDLPPRSIARGAGEGPTCRRPLLDRSHRCARRAGRRHARASLRCGRARRLRGRTRPSVPFPRACAGTSAGSTGGTNPLQLAANAVDTLAPHRGLPVRRRLRVDDVDTAAARRDALGARRRHAPRSVRPSRRVREPGDQGDPRLRAVPVAVRAHAGGGHRGGAGGGLAVRRRVLARRGAGGRPPAPARVLDRVRRPDHRARAAARPPVPARGGWLAAHRPAPVAAPTNGNGAAAVPRRARPATAPDACDRSRGATPARRSGSSTSPRCGPVPTSPSCSPTSAPR